MKILLASFGLLTVVCIVLFNMNWDERNARIQADDEARQEIKIQRLVDYTVKDIIYIKDQRTNLCFAVASRSGHRYYGMGVSQVPCDAIPSSLLRIARAE